MAALAARYPSSNQDKAGGVEPYFPAGARMRSQVTFARLMMLRPVRHGAARRRPEHLRHDAGPQRDARAGAGGQAGDGREPLAPDAVSPERGAGHGHVRRQPSRRRCSSAARWSWRGRSISWGPALDLFKPDAWLVLQCIALCFVTSLVLGLLPALRFSRPAIIAALKNDSAGSGRRVGRLQRFTAAAQAGIAVPFLVICGVQLDQARVTDLRRRRASRRRGSYAARLNLPAIAKTDEERRLFVRTVQENLAQAPGVARSASATACRSTSSIATRASRARARRRSSPRTRRASARAIWTRSAPACSPAARSTRTIAHGAERVVLLSEPLARQLFPAGDPLGAACRLCAGRRRAAGLHRGRRDGRSGVDADGQSAAAAVPVARTAAGIARAGDRARCAF